MRLAGPSHRLAVGWPQARCAGFPVGSVSEHPGDRWVWKRCGTSGLALSWRAGVRVFGQLGVVLALVCAGGCLTGPVRDPAPWPVVSAAGDTAAFAVAQQTVRGAFPPTYRAAQRAIITVHGRQFVCDGVLTVSPAEGWHLAVISTLGLVTDLRLRTDGAAEVLKVTPLFREAWARDYVTRELRWLFTPPPALAPMGRLDDGRLVLEAPNRPEDGTARYVCSADGRRWEELELVSGGCRVFHATIFRSAPLRGWQGAVPAEIDVDSVTHQLHLRIAADAASPQEGAR